MNYEAWRITFQSSEQAARSAFNDASALERKNAELLTKLKLFAREIVKQETRLPDHACAQCAPHSDMLKAGFVCAFHQAQTLLDSEQTAAPSLPDEKEKP